MWVSPLSFPHFRGVVGGIPGQSALRWGKVSLGVCQHVHSGEKGDPSARGREASLTQVPLLSTHLLVYKYANWSLLGLHNSQLLPLYMYRCEF